MSLDAAIKESDIVIFWESSGIFEAVVRNKKIFFLTFSIPAILYDEPFGFELSLIFCS